MKKREKRLRQVIADLIGLVRDLEAAPIPTAWFGPNVRDSSGSLVAGSFDPTWADSVMFYAHRGVALGRCPLPAGRLHVPNIERGQHGHLYPCARSEE